MDQVSLAVSREPLEWDVSAVLNHRRWLCHDRPFRHYTANDVFSGRFAVALEGAMRAILDRGFGERNDPERFSRNMAYSDAYSWNFTPGIDGPLAFFYSRSWHDLLAGLTGVRATGDMNGALHHHQLGSEHGNVHRDLGVAWFSEQARADGINPMDLSRCGYTTGKTPRADIQTREVVRAVTMIYYLGNPAWSPGDGGETGLYRHAEDPVVAPEVVIPPVNNSIVVFENNLDSFHSFLKNRKTTRNSVILWLHRTRAEAVNLWGEASISRW